MPPVTSLADLRGKEVIVQRGGIAHDYLLEKPVGATLVPVDTHAAALRMLAAGKHDYAVVGNLPGMYLGRELGLSNIVPVGKLFPGQQYAYAARKGNAELLAIFSEGLAILKNTGKQRQIYDKWLGPLEPSGILWKKFVPLLGSLFGALLLILGGIVIWNRSLKREVARRTNELQQHQQQLIQADKMASIGILVSGMAHEINNPNSVALLNLPIVIEAYEDCLRGFWRTTIGPMAIFPWAVWNTRGCGRKSRHLLREILGGAERIKRIVEDLKDFARQGNASLEESIDLNRVVHAAVRLVENSIRKATNRFESNLYAEGLPGLRGNAQRIEQVIINLILNACQALQTPNRRSALATYQSSCKQFVSFRGLRRRGAASPRNISPISTTPSSPPSGKRRDRPRSFRVRHASSASMAGRSTSHPSRDRGPRRPSRCPSTGKSMHHEQESADPAFAVLLVDDEPAFLRSLSSRWSVPAGISNILRCQDSRQVLDLLAAQDIGLVLLDLTMPHLSGEELLPMIVEEHPEVGVIVISGLNQVETAVDCMQAWAPSTTSSRP